MKRIILTILVLILLSIYLKAGKQKDMAQSADNDPVGNFERLWREFHDRYAFFDLKKISWENIYKQYRVRIKVDTSKEELFGLCCEMVRTLEDVHVSLVDETGKRQCRWSKEVRFLEEFPNQKAFKSLIDVIDEELVRKGFDEPTRIEMEIPYIDGYIIEYARSTRFGYLRINLMIGLSEPEFIKALDAVITSLKDKEGIIIDVRFNSGGLDSYAYAIANRFADRQRLGHSRSLKDKDGFSSLESHYLKPEGREQIVKPIVLLTSSFTVSAAEVFAMAMKQLPYVTIVGESTQGFFSDTYEDKLPNGWTFTLSFQQYFNAKGQNLEEIGVTPDVPACNTQKDLIVHKDPVLDVALSVLAGLGSEKKRD